MGIERKRREELVSINKSVCQAVIKKQREVRTTENAACKHTMLLTFLYSCTGGAALLYVLYRWLIPAAVQYHGGLALIWHEVIVEPMLDTLTQSTRPQRLLSAVQKNATRGRPL
ncbi:hypothetical protein E3U43_003697 [Larimichthys crocea]|uniref:Uncharacterized protein n=1 Tax=Larimichthys crocea TaxID=215358 RepID=A0ACD3RIQ7_LARCR|nr:hypothetical protein E3U43_003697 [Larimichthys crocea]